MSLGHLRSQSRTRVPASTPTALSRPVETVSLGVKQGASLGGVGKIEKGSQGILIRGKYDFIKENERPLRGMHPTAGRGISGQGRERGKTWVFSYFLIGIRSTKNVIRDMTATMVKFESHL